MTGFGTFFFFCKRQEEDTTVCSRLYCDIAVVDISQVSISGMKYQRKTYEKYANCFPSISGFIITLLYDDCVQL